MTAGSGGEARARAGLGETLVTFPCGHTFHAECIADDACVRCMAARAGALHAPAAAAGVASVAANAELEDTVVAPWIPAPRPASLNPTS